MSINGFATGEYVECAKAKEIASLLNQIKEEYKRATEADGKLYFYCRGCALFDVSNLIQPYEDFDYRLCDSRECMGNECFAKLKKDWEVFVDEVGNGRFTYNSPIGVISSALLNEERTAKRKSALESAINDAIFNLNRRESVQNDLIIISKTLSMINKNKDFNNEMCVIRFKNKLLDDYGVDLDDYDIAKVYDKLSAFYKK